LISMKLNENISVIASFGLPYKLRPGDLVRYQTVFPLPIDGGGRGWGRR